MRFEDRLLQREALVPAIVVSVTARFGESERDYPDAALAVLVRALGGESLRLCQACQVPRTFVTEGVLEQSFGVVGIDEILALDAALRGQAAPAKTAIWLDETETGVALRIVDLANGRIVWVESLDPELRELATEAHNFSLTRELHRRIRGDSLTHAFVDLALYPGQHFSLDWVDQWGASNTHLSGFSFSFWDPLVGVGGAYYHVVPSLANTALGLKVLLSVPTTLVRQFSGNSSNPLPDNLLTGVFVVRVPLFESYGLLLTASTNARIGIGIAMLNTSLLPVLP
jgi:hypothetical protein